MNNDYKKIIGLFSRYLFIILIGLGNLYIIYKILIPLTIGVLHVIFSIFTKTLLIGNIIHSSEIAIEIVPACAAGSAFYLLLILLMSTSKIKSETRLKAVIFAFISLFVLNIIRILILTPMAKSFYFDTIHWIFWHLVSTVFVVGIWLATIKIFKIKSIPVYSDIKYIASLIKPKKPKRKRKNN